jgi:hypothetical protein
MGIHGFLARNRLGIKPFGTGVHNPLAIGRLRTAAEEALGL